jgi:hypothetical protein
MKQTAVEQFIEQLEQQGDSWENVSIGTINISIKVEDYLELQRQAKEMEKQQIIDVIRHTEIDIRGYYNDGDAEFYYNETFKSE